MKNGNKEGCDADKKQSRDFLWHFCSKLPTQEPFVKITSLIVSIAWLKYGHRVPGDLCLQGGVRFVQSD
jgi:hypothetical protein